MFEWFGFFSALKQTFFASMKMSVEMCGRRVLTRSCRCRMRTFLSCEQSAGESVFILLWMGLQKTSEKTVGLEKRARWVFEFPVTRERQNSKRRPHRFKRSVNEGAVMKRRLEQFFDEDNMRSSD